MTTEESWMEFDSPLDAGISRAVIIANGAGFTTYESCEGGEGHAFPEPTVRGFGSYQEAMRAVLAMLDLALPVWELRQVWHVRDFRPPRPVLGHCFRPQVGGYR